MATPGFGLDANATSSQNAAIEQKLRLEQALKGSASWFVTIAVLSIVNSILSMSGAGWHFIFGLGFTEIVDAIAHQVGSAGIVLDLIINGIIAGVFVLFWNFARKGQKWAWFIGMGVYLLDGLILLLFKDFLSAAFHAWALYRMYSGIKLLPIIENLNRASSTGTISSSL